MKKGILILLSAFIAANCISCGSMIACQYGITKDVNKFDDNKLTVTMKGGVIDVDAFGMATNAAEFNPFVVRSAENKILFICMKFNYERTGFATQKKLHIEEESTATFLLNNGENKVVLNALKGDARSSTSRYQHTTYHTTEDCGIFFVTPEELKQIAYSKSVEVRVQGRASYMDFPRNGYHVPPNFIENIKTFYEAEVVPYVNN